MTQPRRRYEEVNDVDHVKQRIRIKLKNIIQSNPDSNYYWY